MLLIAKEKTNIVEYINADICRLPFPDNCINYITIQAALHFISDKNSFFSEVFRVLKPNGIFSILTHNPLKMNKHWIYKIFPSTLIYDEKRFM